MGYLGVMLAMAIESACIPLPSEIIMPMAGWMVYRGVFDLWVVAIVGHHRQHPRVDGGLLGWARSGAGRYF